ncbi:MAG: metal dependent phosphohydrolase [Myxococcales bacterium]|nr:metal dependent phosphohydrolase [Myxococcales bacterium]
MAREPAPSSTSGCENDDLDVNAVRVQCGEHVVTTPSGPSSRAPSNSDSLSGPRAELSKVIPRRRQVRWWIGLLISIVFAAITMALITAERLLASSGSGRVVAGQPAPLTVRVPPFSGYQTQTGRIGGDAAILIARGDIATETDEKNLASITEATPHGTVPYLAYLLLAGVLAGVFTHHTRRSNRGRLLRVQLVNLAIIVISAVIVKTLMLATALSILVVPVALFAMVPTLVLDRVVGLATGTLAALIFAMLVPFDVGVAILLLVQVGAAGLVVTERPKARWRAALSAGAITTLFTGLTYVLLEYLTHGHLPTGSDPLHAAWLAAAIGPAIATVIAVPLIPLYQLLVGEITQQKLVQLEDLSHPLLRQIAEKAPGSWQHSLMMANMAEIAANSIGASGRLVRVGAYFHDLGKSLQPKYFIENLEPGETSPHDRLPPEVSCDAIFAHVTEGILTARRAGLHERIIDFMHMHHGNGVLEYFWAKCREQGNPKNLTVEHFRYPGVPPQSRETAILAICDAVEAASRALKKPDAQSIESLVQRIVYGKLHLGQLDESGLSMSDLRRVADSLRETIRHANHGRIEYPWQKAQQDASASAEISVTTAPRLDSLDRPAEADSVRTPRSVRDDALADTGGLATPKLRIGSSNGNADLGIEATAPVPREAQQSDRMERTSRPPPNERDPERSREPASQSARDSQRDERSSRTSRPPEARSSESSRDESPRGAQTALDGHGQSGRDSQPPREHGRGSQPPRDVSAAPMFVRETDSGAVIVPSRGDAADPQHDREDRGAQTIERKRSPTAAEVKQFATDAAAALNETSNNMAALPREVAEIPSIARKRAATLPPSPAPRRSPTIPPGRPPTQPPFKVDEPSPAASNVPLFASSTPSSSPELAPARVKQPGPVSADERITIPPPIRREALLIEDPPAPAPRRTAEWVARSGSDDSSTTQPRMIRVDDAAVTQPRLERPSSEVGDTTTPRLHLPDHAGSAPLGEDSPWGKELASRIDAALDDDFGTETPVSPPTRAEMQALIGSAPDPTRQQSFEEIERLHREGLQRRSDPILDSHGRHPHPTSEVDPDDIEAAIELAPPARRNTIGIVKKKPGE